MHKFIAPVAIALALAVTSIAAAPVPASAATTREAAYVVSTDIGVVVNEGAGTAGLITPAGNVSVRWVKQAATTGAYAVSIRRTKSAQRTYTGSLSAAGKARLVKALRATKQNLSGKPRLVSVDALAGRITAAAQA